MNDVIRKLDPAVDKTVLIAASGLLWSAVGILLCKRALGWLTSAPGHGPLWPGIAGILLALMIHHFGFLKLVNKNIDRIRAKKGKVCIFGFQPWKSYVIILIMITMGQALRHSALPKPWLAVVYIGFGGAMLLSSVRYFRTFISLLAGR